MNKIIFALDTTNLEEAISITNQIKDKIFTVKLGLEFFNAHGKEGIKKFNEMGITNLMLDLKIKDIPQTVYKAVKALNDVKFSFLTIHGTGGKAMIEEAKKAASEIESQPKILMVTILTALGDDDLKNMGSESGVTQQVEHLSRIAKETGVGVVCSGRDAKIVRRIIGPNLLIFTPGIRMPGDSTDDQRRICTPLESIQSGSDKIIMGRSLTRGNIEDNLNRISNSLKT